MTRWEYIIHGRNCRQFRLQFPCHLLVSSFIHYGGGGRYFSPFQVSHSFLFPINFSFQFHLLQKIKWTRLMLPWKDQRLTLPMLLAALWARNLNLWILLLLHRMMKVRCFFFKDFFCIRCLIKSCNLNTKWTKIIPAAMESYHKMQN